MIQPADVLLPPGVPVWERLAPHFSTWGVVDPWTTLILGLGCNMLGMVEEHVGQGHTPSRATAEVARGIAADMGLPVELVAPWAVLAPKVVPTAPPASGPRRS